MISYKRIIADALVILALLIPTVALDGRPDPLAGSVLTSYGAYHSSRIPLLGGMTYAWYLQWWLKRNRSDASIELYYWVGVTTGFVPFFFYWLACNFENTNFPKFGFAMGGLIGGLLAGGIAFCLVRSWHREEQGRKAD